MIEKVLAFHAIVLDATVIIADPLLSSPSLELVIEALGKTPAQICVPMSVIDEVSFHFQREFYEAAAGAKSKLKRQSARVQQVSDFLNSLDDLAEQDESRYRQQLIDRVTELNGVVLPYPGIDVSSLVRKASLRTLPFSKAGNDSGVKDFVAWNTIIELIDAEKRPDQIVFITGNSSDFCDDNSRLHPDFDSDLASCKSDNPKVDIVSTIDEYLEKYITSDLEAQSALIEGIEDRTARFPELDLYNSVVNYLNTNIGLDTIDTDSIAQLFQSSVRDPKVTGFSSFILGKVDDINVYFVAPPLFIFRGSINIMANITAAVHRDDLPSLSSGFQIETVPADEGVMFGVRGTQLITLEINCWVTFGGAVDTNTVTYVNTAGTPRFTNLLGQSE